MCFLKNIDNKKLEESDVADNDVYILHVKRYAIKTCSGLKNDVAHNDVYTLHIKRIIFKDP
jgi:hypothetical protein